MLADRVPYLLLGAVFSLLTQGVAVTVCAAWGPTARRRAFITKAKAENTAGGIVFEAACGRQDCDGWEENG